MKRNVQKGMKKGVKKSAGKSVQHFNSAKKRLAQIEDILTPHKEQAQGIQKPEKSDWQPGHEIFSIPKKSPLEIST